MSKTFTLGEAQTLLPVVEALLRRAQAAGVRARELDLEMQALSQRIFLLGGMHVDVTVAARRRAELDKSVQETKDTLTEIEAIGVQIKRARQGPPGLSLRRRWKNHPPLLEAGREGDRLLALA